MRIVLGSPYPFLLVFNIGVLIIGAFFFFLFFEHSLWNSVFTLGKKALSLDPGVSLLLAWQRTYCTRKAGQAISHYDFRKERERTFSKQRDDSGVTENKAALSAGALKQRMLY